MAKWSILLATSLLAAVRAEIVEKETGYVTQRVSVPTDVPSDYEPELPLPDVDSSEDGVARASRGTSCNCGWANRNRDGVTRIVGGSYYAPNEYPFVAGIARRSGQGYSAFCGGSIITPNHVITVAHCTDDYIKNRTPIFVLLGTHDRSRPSSTAVIIPVSTISQHQSYNPRFFVHDIAILTLSRSIAYNRIIGPVCMPLNGLDVSNRRVRILGWGAEKFQGLMTTRPKQLDTTAVTPDTCSRAWGGSVSANRPTQICTHTRRESACQGDSGGPVIWLDPQTNRYTLVGLVSFGSQCNDVRPEVHTRVEAYLPWIRNVIAANRPGATCQKV